MLKKELARIISTGAFQMPLKRKRRKTPTGPKFWRKKQMPPKMWTIHASYGNAFRPQALRGGWGEEVQDVEP